MQFLTTTPPQSPTSSPSGSKILNTDKKEKSTKKSLRQSLTNLSILERKEIKDKDKDKEECKEKEKTPDKDDVHKRIKHGLSLFFKSREEKENALQSPERKAEIPVPPPPPSNSRSISVLSRSHDKIQLRRDKDKDKEKDKDNNDIPAPPPPPPPSSSRSVLSRSQDRIQLRRDKERKTDIPAPPPPPPPPTSRSKSRKDKERDKKTEIPVPPPPPPTSSRSISVLSRSHDKLRLRDRDKDKEKKNEIPNSPTTTSSRSKDKDKEKKVEIPVPPPPPSSRSKSILNRSHEKIKREKDHEKEKSIPVCDEPQDHYKLSGFLSRFFQNRPSRQALVEKHILTPDFKTPDTIVIALRAACIRAIGARLEQINGFDREGLFRIPGSVMPVREIWKRFQELPAPDFTEDPRIKEQGPHEYAGALKLYLREAPESAIPMINYESFLSVLDCSPDEKSDQLAERVFQLDKDSIEVLEELLKLWCKVVHMSSKNKMDIKNVGIIFGPSVLRQKCADPLAMMDLKLTQRQSAVVELLMENATKLFPSIEDELKAFNTSLLSRDTSKDVPLISPTSPPSPFIPVAANAPTDWARVVAHKSPLMVPKLQLCSSTTALPTASKSHLDNEPSPEIPKVSNGFLSLRRLTRSGRSRPKSETQDPELVNAALNSPNLSPRS